MCERYSGGVIRFEFDGVSSRFTSRFQFIVNSLCGKRESRAARETTVYELLNFERSSTSMAQAPVLSSNEVDLLRYST